MSDETAEDKMSRACGCLFFMALCIGLLAGIVIQWSLA